MGGFSHFFFLSFPFFRSGPLVRTFYGSVLGSFFVISIDREVLLWDVLNNLITHNPGQLMMSRTVLINLCRDSQACA